MKRLAMALLFAVFCLPSSQANIGFTLRQSRSAYGSRGTSMEDGSVAWNYNGWKITERYGSDGYCSNVIYEARTITESEILDLLRANTPKGVSWEEDTSTIISATWRSTKFISNGFACHMRAMFSGGIVGSSDPNFKPTLSSLSIQVVP